jgi:hypothetical protein
VRGNGLALYTVLGLVAWTIALAQESKAQKGMKSVLIFMLW